MCHAMFLLVLIPFAFPSTHHDITNRHYSRFRCRFTARRRREGWSQQRFFTSDLFKLGDTTTMKTRYTLGSIRCVFASAAKLSGGWTRHLS